MRDVARATRAALAVLAGGGSLRDALRIAGQACDRAELGARYGRAADDLGSDSFRADVIGKLPWAPSVVGLLLARAPRPSLAGVAASSLSALPGRTTSAFDVIARAYVALLALAAGAVAEGLDRWLPEILGGEPLSPLVVPLAGGAFALAALSQAWASVRERSPTQASLLHWFVAAERAGLPPGAVLEPIIEGAPLSGRSLEKLRRDLRGVTTVRDAITVWAESDELRGPAARLAGLVPDGDDPVGAAERMARVAALDRSSGAERWLLHLGYVVVAAAVLALARGVLGLLARSAA